MGFEYRLEKWNGMAVFQILKMPEELRGEMEIYACSNGWKIKSIWYKEISTIRKIIYLRGTEKECDNNIAQCNWSDEIPAALEEFAQWCERKYGLCSKFTDKQLETLRTLRRALGEANYIAMDDDGEWRLFAIEPRMDPEYGAWATRSGVSCEFCIKRGVLPTDIPWKESLFDLDDLLGGEHE